MKPNAQFKYKRKHYLTLLEMLIAMAILSVLLTIVFGFFRELTKIDEWAKFQQTQNFQKRYVESRLFYLFSRLVNDASSIRKPFFFCDPPVEHISTSPSLVFTYNNGVRLNTNFSGDILARLYVNKNKQLCLAVWPEPDPKSDPIYDMQKEILLDQVENVKFEFFAAPHHKYMKPNETPPEMNRGGWDEKWPLSYKQTPSLMKMTLTRKLPLILEKKAENNFIEEELNFMFYLPISKGFNNFIYYKK